MRLTSEGTKLGAVVRIPWISLSKNTERHAPDEVLAKAQICASIQLRMRPEFGLGVVGVDQETSRGEHRKRGERSLTALGPRDSVDIEKRESGALQVVLGHQYLVCFSSLMVYGDGGSSFPKSFGLNIRRPKKPARIGLDESSF